MPYATIEDLARLGVPATVLTGVSLEAQEAALASASSLADGYLAAQFALPLTAWGDDLRSCICAIAAWQILRVRGFDPEGSADAAVRLGHEDAIEWLEKVAAGKVAPQVTDSTPTEDDAGPFVVAPAPRGW